MDSVQRLEKEVGLAIRELKEIRKEMITARKILRRLIPAEDPRMDPEEAEEQDEDQ